MATELRNDPYQALRFPEFRAYVTARLLVTTAMSLPVVLLGWKLYEMTHDTLILGNVYLAEIIPALGIALFAGHQVDKRDKRSLLRWCFAGYFVYGLLLLLITSGWALNRLPVNTAIFGIYAITFAGGILRAFSEPAGFSLVAQLTPREAYVNAATWSSSSWMTGSIVGPAVGGLLYAWVGITWTFGLMLLLLAFAFAAIGRIDPKPPIVAEEEESIWTSLSQGIRFVFNTKVVLGALSLDMFAVLFGGAVALLPVYADDILHCGPEGLGILRAATSVGTFVTLLTVAFMPIRSNPGTKLLLSVFGFGICIIVFGISTNFYLSFFCLFMSGVLDGVSVIIRRAILQLKTPDEMRGRVASVNSMFVGSSNELGGYESGLTASLMGTVPAVVFGGCMTLLVVLITWFKVPALRDLDLED